MMAQIVAFRRRRARIAQPPSRPRRRRRRFLPISALTRLALAVAATLAAPLAIDVATGVRSADPAALWARAQGLIEAAAPAGPEACRVVRVVDGDTLRITCSGTGEVRARLVGFDTPEVFSPRCAEEKRLGDAATERLSALLAEAGSVRFAFEGRDRYGRALTRLWIDGRDAAALMVGAGLARPYGGGRRARWCDGAT